MGPLIGLGVGTGLLLVWSAFALPPISRVSTSRNGWLARRLGEAGLNRVSVSGLLTVSLGLGVAATVVIQLVSGTLPVALAFGAMAAYLPLVIVAARARRRRREFAEVWPEA